MITTLNTNSNPQRAWGVQASTVPIITPTGRVVPILKPTQIVGLVPLTCVDQDPRLPAFSKCDCREWTNDDCYINPVFADMSDTDLIKNDHNMFLLEYPFFYPYQWANSSASLMVLQEWNGSMWINVVNLVDNTYGTFYDFNSLCIANWKGYDISWQKVLQAFGEGLYRIRITYTIASLTDFIASEPFCLKEWSCEGTDVTVRWEATITGGQIGSITTDCKVFNFCCLTNPEPGSSTQIVSSVTWYDQIRVYAFFGKETTEYERVNVEYSNGDVIQVRNEAIQKFEYESALQPKWLHDRLKAYCFMADDTYVTDYNWNNSDYEIQKKRVVCDGAYAPEYNENTRYANVKVVFKEGCQNVIRDKCCDLPNRSSGS